MRSNSIADVCHMLYLLTSSLRSIVPHWAAHLQEWLFIRFCATQCSCSSALPIKSLYAGGDESWNGMCLSTCMHTYIHECELAVAMIVRVIGASSVSTKASFLLVRMHIGAHIYYKRLYRHIGSLCYLALWHGDKWHWLWLTLCGFACWSRRHVFTARISSNCGFVYLLSCVLSLLTFRRSCCRVLRSSLLNVCY